MTRKTPPSISAYAEPQVENPRPLPTAQDFSTRLLANSGKLQSALIALKDMNERAIWPDLRGSLATLLTSSTKPDESSGT